MLEPFREALSRGENLLVERLWDSPKAALLAAAQEELGRNIVVVTGGLREERLLHDLAYFSRKPVHEFPAWETLPSEAILPSPDVVGERYRVLRALQDAGPHIVVCPLQAALQRLMPPEQFYSHCRTLRVKESVSFESFLEQLEKLGFRRRPVASDKGEYAVRGGIIDLFPIGTPNPYRLEFWGDEIDSIRLYDPASQRSIEKVDHLDLTLAGEHLQGELATLFDYVGSDALLVLDDLLALEDRYVALKSLPGAISRSFASMSQFLEEAPSQRLLFSAETIEELSDVSSEGERLQFSALGHPFQAVRFGHPFAPITEHLEDLEIESAPLSSGFVLGSKALVSSDEKRVLRRQKLRGHVHTTSREYLELQPGDLVVHLQNGIGRYLGVERQGELEVLAIEYAERATLYVPMTQAHLVTKYIGAHEEHPKLHAMGSRIWARTRAKTEAAIQDYAKELIRLQAERQVAGGFAYPPDGEMMEQFEREFPFVETDDQLLAIESIKQDMQSPEPMDRLVCGDVGYGKTEVAMRAAFKAVADGGKQVAVLVPTTVLALQHYENFQERMAKFPIRVGLLSRLGGARKTQEGVAAGSVDIVIGTHRLLSKNVEFKRLGLVIIDEEQRFGVRAKERLRSARAGVDSLSLSATPIPRTLYMALMGARHLSTINTPPQDRLPIKTILQESDDEKVRAAILRELARDGQTYYIHNRVESIYEVARDLEKLVPQARVIVGHGQMEPDALDRVFHTFKSGEADILVATTIVENGVDIPHANTIIVDRAHAFGLADLYQLRGRVGRWNRRAYAYFLTPARRQLPELSQRRLQALEEIGGYGGGMKVAMRDLEIRGAGNILGTEQSGHVSAIGFHFYCRLLKRAVHALQGKRDAALAEVRMDFPFDARLPDSYVSEPSLRMEIYGRYGECANLEEAEALYEELQDRFGPPPEPAAWLHATMRFRILAAERGVRSLVLKKHTLTLERKGEKRTHMVRPIGSPTALEEQLATFL